MFSYSIFTVWMAEIGPRVQPRHAYFSEDLNCCFAFVQFDLADAFRSIATRDISKVESHATLERFLAQPEGMLPDLTCTSPSRYNGSL